MTAAAGRSWLGFDEHGEVRDLGHLVHRTIREDYKSIVAQLHRAYRNGRLSTKGIIETTLRADGDLEHRKLVTSYPYEWSAGMYKEAVLFHLGLFVELKESGLTLKDALPNNILFDHTKPVFVDFLSLVQQDKLVEEKWLAAGGYADARFAVAETMLLPYMILPLLFMSRGQYGKARELLSTRSCNCDGAPPSWRELLDPNRAPGLGWVRSYLRSLWAAAVLHPIRAGNNKAKGEGAFNQFVEGLIRRVRSTDVTPWPSGYSAYYDEKKEALSLSEPSTFLPKQRSVYEVLHARKPRSVLDIGANTGWFSVLAESLGASVVALEEDEACVDILYQRAKARALRILPLRASFGELTTEIHGARSLTQQYGDRGVGEVPLYRAPVDRLGAELVLALGILHHLVLGEGRSLESVFEVLHKLTERVLVLEFVSLDDEKILQEPGFFPNLGKFTQDNYNLERVAEVGRRFFTSIDLMPSHPATRSILVLAK